MTSCSRRYHMGWFICGSGDYWEAHQYGVRMRGNSLPLIKRMIELKVYTERERIAQLKKD